jgi:hypothetical protein
MRRETLTEALGEDEHGGQEAGAQRVERQPKHGVVLLPGVRRLIQLDVDLLGVYVPISEGKPIA